jgi:hypothetical protein
MAGVAFAHTRKWEETFENKAAPELTIRPMPCPAEYHYFLSDPGPAPDIG